MRTIEEIQAERKLLNDTYYAKKLKPDSPKACEAWEELVESDNELLLELFQTITNEIPIDRLREICQAEREGRVVVLPVKAASEAYRIYNTVGGKTGICKGQISSYHLCIENEFYFSDPNRVHSIWVNLSNFGKTVFLTKEEAEKALAERGKV